MHALLPPLPCLASPHLTSPLTALNVRLPDAPPSTSTAAAAAAAVAVSPQVSSGARRRTAREAREGTTQASAPQRPATQRQKRAQLASLSLSLSLAAAEDNRASHSSATPHVARRPITQSKHGGAFSLVRGVSMRVAVALALLLARLRPLCFQQQQQQRAGRPEPPCLHPHTALRRIRRRGQLAE